MAHTGYICPVQDCRDAVYAVGFGYCVKHCIEFGIVCVSCGYRAVSIDTQPLCNRCYGGKCLHVGLNEIQCGRDTHEGCTRCTKHAIDKGEICSCHLIPTFRGGCLYRMKKDICTEDGCMTTVFAGGRCFLCLKKRHVLCATDKCILSAKTYMHHCYIHHQLNIDAGLICPDECEHVVLKPFSRCEKHSRMAGEICKEEKCVNPTILKKYCGSHAKMYGVMCKIDGCYVAIADTVVNGSGICPAHVCYICGDVADADGVICSVHICAAPNCGLLINNELDKYCEKHKCLLCRDKAAFDQLHCVNHRCIHSRCKKPRISDRFPYCLTHKCRVADCPGHISCSNHKCRAPGCIRRIDSIKHEYCRKHICIVKPCIQKRIEGLIVCQDHLTCAGCMLRVMVKNKQCTPIHYLTLCPGHAKCNMCIAAANTSMIDFEPACVRMCHNKAWEKYFHKRIKVPFVKSSAMCHSHAQRAIILLILCAMRCGVYFSRDVLRVIWTFLRL